MTYIIGNSQSSTNNDIPNSVSSLTRKRNSNTNHNSHHSIIIPTTSSNNHHHHQHVLDTDEYIKTLSNGKFNFAPRGFGRQSFRFSEIIQLGRIPIYVYDDIPWIPYEGTTNISINASFTSYI